VHAFEKKSSLNHKFDTIASHDSKLKAVLQSEYFIIRKNIKNISMLNYNIRSRAELCYSILFMVEEKAVKSIIVK
jgi:lipoate synthase